jgi:hypothetical protein
MSLMMTIRKYSTVFFLLLMPQAFSAETSKVVEDWKGPLDESVLSFGGMTGVGLINGNAGFGFLGTVSKKIMKQGFVPDISNSTSLELALGPVFFSRFSAFTYSFHLRWDFEKDAQWGFYALGGLGGNVIQSSSEFYPRFGVGAFYKTSGLMNVRMELSHEWMGVGIVVPFY